MSPTNVIVFLDDLGRILATASISANALAAGENIFEVDVRVSGRMDRYILIDVEGRVTEGQISEEVSELDKMFAYSGLEIDRGLHAVNLRVLA